MRRIGRKHGALGLGFSSGGHGDRRLEALRQGQEDPSHHTVFAGGGTDVYGRVVARHMGRYLAGKPTVIVQNMPGAGGTIAFKG